MLNRFLEFFIVGVILGVVEDLIVISVVTERQIDLNVLIFAFLIAFPFAVFSELIVDHEKFKELMKRWFHG